LQSRVAAELNDIHNLSDAEYRKFWNNLYKIEVRLVEKIGSWNAEDRSVYRIHCPDRTGTVWEMHRIE